ncbi:cadmium-translocating P-type ATPase [Campylobacterota bacterium]|nr:cadmium-translocating P-type ATPase [Campylobacterota bacterium]
MQARYPIKGVGCAVCASKIEAAVSKLDGVESAVIDIATNTLSLTANGDRLDDLIAKINTLMKRIEPRSSIVKAAHKGANAAANTDDEGESALEKINKIALWIGGVLFALAMLGTAFVELPSYYEFALFFVCYLLVGGEVIGSAVRNIFHGRVFDENFLMSVASIGAFCIGEYPEGVAVMLFYRIGEAFQDRAVAKSRRSITALMDIRPDFANLQTPEGLRQVAPADIAVGETIVIRVGEKVPLDCVVTSGISALDTSALTGESLPREIENGSEVLSGSINLSGVITARVTKPFGESTVSKILELVQNASSRKSPTEQFITRFARYYTPAVVFGAIALAALPPLLIEGALFDDWLHRALVFLVISCPCALVISVPLSYFGGIGGASKNGILIKGSNYLEALSRVDTIVFDKTGTLTMGAFALQEIRAASGFDGATLLRFAAYAESYSTHPIAQSIVRAYTETIDDESVFEREEFAGLGTRGVIDGKETLVGNIALMKRFNIACEPLDDTDGSVVYIAIGGVYAGALIIADQIKPQSAGAIAALKRLGVRQIAMLTGDSQTVAKRIAATLGIDRVYAKLLPHEKVERIEELQLAVPRGKKLVFVGDGINDAPALSRADIGIAIGGVGGSGSDAALEAADVVLIDGDPHKAATAIMVAKKTQRIVWQNIVLALSVKGIILVLGALGIASMWAAVFGDVGVALLAILNAMRALRI